MARADERNALPDEDAVEARVMNIVGVKPLPVAIRA
jgi:hypothetical protein